MIEELSLYTKSSHRLSWSNTLDSRKLISASQGVHRMPHERHPVIF